ncbi:MAG: DNA repair protein RadA [Lachnospiraceae bacterium]
MAKAKTVFFCKECGFESAKWLGQCPGCRAWNSFTEEPVTVQKKKTGNSGLAAAASEPLPLNQVSSDEEERIRTGIKELDRVLGGGIVRGSLVLVGGDPGIGKSTLLLQMCRELSSLTKPVCKVLYISGEESMQQIKMRADRLGEFPGEVLLLSETNLELIEQVLEREKPDIVVVDSIQTMYREEVGAAPGSVSQVREATASFLRLAKGKNITIFIVGHVTKEGTVAGPRMLEHMVDTVLYFEGDNSAVYRILRAVKNRFGSTNEIGVFEMAGNGLLEVQNPSQYMLEGRPEGEPGSVVVPVMEGTRPILVEVQALVCQTNFNMPRRTAAGVDYNRVNLLMAVMEKRMGISLAGCDAYVNVAGGMKVTEPSIDLAIVLALLSSYKNRALDSNTIAFGEVGLTGEVRSTSMTLQRIREAEKMGYERCIIPRSKASGMATEQTGAFKIRLIEVGSIRELAQLL